jgi:hypothetical protein
LLQRYYQNITIEINMKLYKSFLLLAIACCSFGANCQRLPVDVAIRTELSAPLPWILGSTYELRLIVENRSDLDTQGFIRQTFLVPGLVDRFEFIADSCLRNADCEQFGSLCYDTPVLAARSSAECVLTRRPLQLRGQDFFARYTYQNLISTQFDPDLSNNSADVRINLVAVPVTQLPLSPLSYGLMGLLLLGLGGLVVRRS